MCVRCGVEQVPAAPAPESLRAFLLARIAEDEGAAAHGDGGVMDEDGATFSRARVLAQCAALRRVVDLLSEAEATGDRLGPYTDDATVGAALALEATLRALVQPYADHPDFDPAWRLA
ncbi:DUF6221 family protein [Actinotalea sp.]|uniref:DUF6221 family protein n=1 Tax=Actinotalea sp. TaxID=1872145 RepID=UPI0035648017